MPGCAAIKANDMLCRNYAMKGKTCCRVHQYLENTEPEKPEVTEARKFLREFFQKWKKHPRSELVIKTKEDFDLFRAKKQGYSPIDPSYSPN